ncbi:MAG: ABC transporter substrate-binding protein [Carbonactinosporaceae bacterium]
MPRLLRIAAPALAAMLLTTSCGSSGSETASAGLDPKDPMTIKVGEVAGIPSAFLQYGQNQGFFTKHGLNLKIETAAGGAAIIPGIVSGDYAMGGSNIVSVVLATSKGLPIRMVTSGTSIGQTKQDDFSAVLVSPGGGIREPADLEGKTIAVNTLQNISEVTVKAALEKHGVDPESVKFTEVGFPEMLPSLEKGEIDAVHEIEPFVTLGIAGGFKPIAWPYAESRPGMQIGSYVTHERYLSEHPDVVKAFQAGIADTAAAIEKDPEAFRKALPDLSELSPEAAQKAVLPVWRASADPASIEFASKKMIDYGLIDAPVDVDKILAPGATS